MSDGHRTSTIARPRVDRATPDVIEPRFGRKRRARRDGASPLADVAAPPGRAERPDRASREPDRDRNDLLSDFTTPIERSKQLVPQRRGRLVVALFATVIALAIGAALFVLPIKSWLKQRADLSTRTGELQTLDAANDKLQSEVDRLQTDAGIKEAARVEIDYTDAGEHRITIITGTSQVVLPPGWPYNMVTEIVALRAAEASAAAATPPPTP